jgi:hypothetical protein
MVEEVDSGTGSSSVGLSLPGLVVNLNVIQVLCLSRLLLPTRRPLPLLELIERHCLFFRFTSYQGLEFVFEFWLLLLEIARIEALLFLLICIGADRPWSELYHLLWLIKLIRKSASANRLPLSLVC